MHIIKMQKHYIIGVFFLVAGLVGVIFVFVLFCMNYFANQRKKILECKFSLKLSKFTKPESECFLWSGHGAKC